MIGESEDLRSDIPNVRMIRHVTVLRWAANEPNPGKDYSFDPPPEEIAPAHVLNYLARINYYVSETDSSDPTKAQSILGFNHVESFYTAQGLLAELREYEEGTLAQRERYAYDERGRLLRKVVEDHVDQNLEQEERHYDAQGHILKKVVTYSDGSQRITDHIWRENTDESITSSDEGVESHSKQTYDENNRTIEFLEIDPVTGASKGTFQDYDSKGKLSALGQIESDGSRWISETWEYNEEGDETAWAEFNRDGETLQERLSTYENGIRIEERLIDRNGETVTSFQYDSDHRRTGTRSLGPEIESESVYVYGDDGLLLITASRAFRGGGGYGVHRTFGSANTTWLEYEFYPQPDTASEGSESSVSSLQTDD